MPQRIEVNRQDGEVKESSRRFDDRDLKYLATWVVDEFHRRKNADERKEKEKQWKEIDRQIAMKPEIEFKKLPNGQIDPKKAWMAEMETPFQALAQEVLTSDASRFMFPDNGPWFRANCALTDDYLRNFDYASIVHGDESKVPSKIAQDDCDKLVEGFLLHCFRQYEHKTQFDKINAEAISYGMGIGRGRKQTKRVFIHSARGTYSQDQKLPVIVPVSVKNTLLDDAKPSMHSSQVLAPSHIAHEWMRYENLAIAASKGSSDPDNEDGGWMPKQVGKIQPDKNGYIQIIEIEGDVIVPRKTVRSVVIPNAIITVALGSAESDQQPASKAVVRLRFRKHPFSSYLLFPYHFECADQIYSTGPLMKGRPVQMLITDALNRCMDSGALKVLPPISYDQNDPLFGQSGGPEIFPGAMWGSADSGSIKAHTEIGGDPSALFQIMMQAVSLYAQLTGVLPARIGAQTVSHTTAYAKGAELQQGAVRTVDYVNSVGNGAITRWLEMAYTLGREAINKEISFFIDAYGGYVTIDKKMLPENVGFEWFGSGGPQDQNQRNANKIGAAEAAVKIDQLRIQLGMPPRVNLDGLQDELLRDGGWRDLAAITTAQGPSGGNAPASGVQGTAENNPGAQVAAIQNLTGAGG